MSPSRHLKPTGSLYSNQEYVDMKDDPSMRYVYSSQRPAAGYPSPQVPYDMEPHPTGRRHYEMASDVVGNLIQLISLIFVDVRMYVNVEFYSFLFFI